MLGAMAKCLASDTAMQVTNDAVQIFGDYGFVKDFPVERYMRDAKVIQIYEGLTRSSAWSYRGSCSAYRGERRLDLEMAQQEVSHVAPFPAYPAGDFLVALAVLQGPHAGAMWSSHSARHARSRAPSRAAAPCLWPAVPRSHPKPP
jgi:hypothetical protein